MDIRVKNTIGKLQVQADVVGIEPGTDLQRVTDALHAVRKGMLEVETTCPDKHVEVPAIRKTPVQNPLHKDWHNEKDTQRIKDLESHIVVMQVKAESDQRIIEQQKRLIKKHEQTIYDSRKVQEEQIKQLTETADAQRDPDSHGLACWAAKHDVTLKFYRQNSHIPYDHDTSRQMILELATADAASTQLVKNKDSFPLGTLFQRGLIQLREVQDEVVRREGGGV